MACRMIIEIFVVSYPIYFSDQKIADQFAVRRMHCWYMPIFRQFIEWSILNAGVVLRERKDGKKQWTGLNLKMAIAKDLAFLGKKPAASTDNETLDLNSDSDEGCETLLLNPVRLRKDLTHIPSERSKRLVCRVHKQRKLTRYQCLTCKKAVCLGKCWLLYHSRKDYVWDDPNCTGKVIHPKSID